MALLSYGLRAFVFGGFLVRWLVGRRRTRGTGATPPAYGQATALPPAAIPTPSWWRGHSLSAVTAIELIVFVSIAPTFAGYLLEPRGLHFTGALVGAEDAAQHEAWASEMAAHLWYQNLFTPEPTPRGWFVSPLNLVLGLAQKATGLPYSALRDALTLACGPALGFGLMTLARRAGLGHPGAAAAVALLAGSFAPFGRIAARVGLLPQSREMLVEVGADATPVFTPVSSGPDVSLMLAVLVLVALPASHAEDPVRGFRWAGVVLLALAAVYPFFIPTLWLTAGLCALLWARQRGWRPMLRGVAWLGVISAPPMLYWAVLPKVDSEFAHFAAANRLPLLSLSDVLVSLGLGSGAIIGMHRLLRANAYQQMLTCFTVALMVALYIPAHPWRSHLFQLSPVLVIAALAAWWPILQRLHRGRRWILVGALLAAATTSTPYYYRRYIDGLAHPGPPAYLTSGDVAAIQWISEQRGSDVVLARSYLSPWVVARGHHRVVVGHWLWTHGYERRLREVEAVFEGGADPQPLVRAAQVAWVLIDEHGGTPEWARDVEPAARFGQTVVLRADRLLEHLEAEGRRTAS